MEADEPVQIPDATSQGRDRESDLPTGGAEVVLLDEIPDLLGTGLPATTRRRLSVIGEVAITAGLNSVLRVGRAPSGGGWEQTEYLVLSPVEREALLTRLLDHRSVCQARLAEGVRRNLPEGPQTPAELVIANYLRPSERPQHRTAAAYAAGIVAGQFAPVEDWKPFSSIAAALGASAFMTVTLTRPDGAVAHDNRVRIGVSTWRDGLRLIHALADGAIVNPVTGEAYGALARLVDERLGLSGEVFRGTGLILAEFTRAFGGDVFAAAGAFVRATQSLNRPFDLAA